MHAELLWQQRQCASIFGMMLQVNWPDAAAWMQCFNIQTWRTCQAGNIFGLSGTKWSARGFEWGCMSSLLQAVYRAAAQICPSPSPSASEVHLAGLTERTSYDNIIYRYIWAGQNLNITFWILPKSGDNIMMINGAEMCSSSSCRLWILYLRTMIGAFGAPVWGMKPF